MIVVKKIFLISSPPVKLVRTGGRLQSPQKIDVSMLNLFNQTSVLQEELSKAKTPSSEPGLGVSGQEISEAAGFGPSQIQNPKSEIENDNAVVSRLAVLTPLGYDRVRKSEASKLGVRAEILDTEVARRRAELKQEHDVREVLDTLHCPVPWPEPVDIREVLHQVSSR